MLKQFGYNVAKENALTATQRHKILEMLIDNNICSRETVISYLSYFINMRKNRRDNIFAEAISKWESDLEYIEQYKANKGKRIRVKSITRK